jgi:hypothetical protein
LGANPRPSGGEGEEEARRCSGAVVASHRPSVAGAVVDSVNRPAADSAVALDWEGLDWEADWAVAGVDSVKPPVDSAAAPAPAAAGARSASPPSEEEADSAVEDWAENSESPRVDWEVVEWEGGVVDSASPPPDWEVVDLEVEVADLARPPPDWEVVDSESHLADSVVAVESAVAGARSVSPQEGADSANPPPGADSVAGVVDSARPPAGWVEEEGVRVDWAVVEGARSGPNPRPLGDWEVGGGWVGAG